MNGPPVSSVVDRVNGCKQAFAKAPGIKVLSDNQNGKGSREGGLEVMIGLLTANADIDAVFTINDPQAIGADLAAKQLGFTESSSRRWTAPRTSRALSSAGHPDRGVRRTGPLRDGAEGGRGRLQDRPGQEPAESTILIPAELITRENVGQYEGWTAAK